MKKYLAGLVLMMLMVFAVPKMAFADAAAPEAMSYWAYIANPDGVNAGDLFIPYGSEVEVEWEVFIDGEYLAIFSWGDNHGLETLLSNITPKDVDLSRYFAVEYETKRHTIATTTLYGGPGLAFPVVQTLDAGVDLTVTHYSGDMFVRVIADGIEGWALDCSTPIGDATIAADVDYEAYIFSQDAEKCDYKGEGTGEFIKPGTKVKVVGEISQGLAGHKRLEVDLGGNNCFIDQQYAGVKAEYPEAFYVTDPSLVRVYKGYELKQMIEYELQADTVLELYQVYWADRNHVYYELEPEIFMEFDSYIYYGDTDLGLYPYYYVIADTEEFYTSKEIKCYWDVFGKRERSVINAGDTYEFCFNTCIGEDYRYYAKGYGWFAIEDSEDDYDEITDVEDINTKKDDTTASVNTQKGTKDDSSAVKAFNKTLLISLIFALVISIAALVAICCLGKRKNDK